MSHVGGHPNKYPINNNPTGNKGNNNDGFSSSYVSNGSTYANILNPPTVGSLIRTFDMGNLKILAAMLWSEKRCWATHCPFMCYVIWRSCLIQLGIQDYIFRYLGGFQVLFSFPSHDRALEFWIWRIGGPHGSKSWNSGVGRLTHTKGLHGSTFMGFLLNFGIMKYSVKSLAHLGG